MSRTKRAIALAKKLKKSGITVVASSSNSLEDILAAEYLVKQIQNIKYY